MRYVIFFITESSSSYLEDFFFLIVSGLQILFFSVAKILTLYSLWAIFLKNLLASLKCSAWKSGPVWFLDPLAH